MDGPRATPGAAASGCRHRPIISQRALTPNHQSRWPTRAAGAPRAARPRLDAGPSARGLTPVDGRARGAGRTHAGDHAPGAHHDEAAADVQRQHEEATLQPVRPQLQDDARRLDVHGDAPELPSRRTAEALHREDAAMHGQGGQAQVPTGRGETHGQPRAKGPREPRDPPPTAPTRAGDGLAVECRRERLELRSSSRVGGAGPSRELERLAARHRLGPRRARAPRGAVCGGTQAAPTPARLTRRTAPAPPAATPARQALPSPTARSRRTSSPGRR
jgi:hypothetical protein